MFFYYNRDQIVQTHYFEYARASISFLQKIVQKFSRNEDKNADDDIAKRTFAIVERKIHLKYHYGKGHVTASTRTFIKPPLAEMGEGMVFRPELTYGYLAEIGAKPPRQQKLFVLFEEQLREEEVVISNIRDIENQVVV